MSLSEAAAFHFHRVRRESSNFSLLKSLAVGGHIVSQHQSGTHWLKYMLANAMANYYGTPPPEFNHANDIIGGPKDPIVYPQIPRIISSHAIPPIGLAALAQIGVVELPKTIVLVRDIRASLVSNYRKWESRYGVPFEVFLRGDPAGKRYNSDIWWCFRFQNAWAKLGHALPGRILATHYEALQADTAQELKKIVGFLELPIGNESITHGINAASKSAMKSRADPERPPGEVHTEVLAVNDWYKGVSRDYFTRLCREFLHADFGYDYANWG